MAYFKFLIAVVVGLFLLDQLGLWLERRGWLYWRHRKPSAGGGVGNALQELNALMNPSVRHVIKAKEKSSQKKERRSEDTEPSI